MPLQQQSIIKELLQHYKDHELIEHIDSPYRAATVRVAKKNVTNSSNVTDYYRLVIDYYSLTQQSKIRTGLFRPYSYTWNLFVVHSLSVLSILIVGITKFLVLLEPNQSLLSSQAMGLVSGLGM